MFGRSFVPAVAQTFVKGEYDCFMFNNYNTTTAYSENVRPEIINGYFIMLRQLTQSSRNFIYV